MHREERTHLANDIEVGVGVAVTSLPLRVPGEVDVVQAVVHRPIFSLQNNTKKSLSLRSTGLKRPQIVVEYTILCLYS